MGSFAASMTVLVSTVCLNPTEDVAVDRVDLVEVNHFYDEQGRLVFDQIIFYDWSPEDSHFHIRAWRLLKRPAQIPHRNWRQRDFVAVWHDGPVLRKVRAATLRESWTQYDPELIEREYLPTDKRRKLTSLEVKK